MSRNTPWRTARKMYALRQSTNDWYRIRNQVDGPPQLHIYDEIGYFGVSASDLIRDLANIEGPLEVHLNSPGGEVFDGIAIYNALLARKDVTVCIDGLAASIASVIAMAGNPVLIARNAQMMVHDGFGMAIGNAQDLRELAELLDRTSNNIASIYSDHTGRPADYWRQIMKAETWYSSSEAIDAGLADRTIDSGAGRVVAVSPEDKWDLSNFRQSATIRSAVTTSQTQHAPVAVRHAHIHHGHGSGEPPTEDGMHLHAHTHNGDNHHDHHHAWDPDGDGDDDSTPGGDTDHDHWSESGQQMKSVPGMPLDSYGNLIDIKTARSDTSPWDASRAMHNGEHSNTPAAFFEAVCAGRLAGQSDDSASWALAHHYHPGDAPNVIGIRNALSRLNQITGLTNKEAARAHLESHMREINPDWNPADSAGGPFGLSAEDIKKFTDSIRL